MKVYIDKNDLVKGNWLTKKSEYNNFGGNGNNTPPKLSWEDLPQETKSLAVTLYDKDATTGSGFWHWIVINIPKESNELTLNQSLEYTNIKNDFGHLGYGGACPPEGDSKHLYQFTIHALDIERLEIGEDTPNAIVRFMINNHTVEKISIDTYYQR